MQTKEIIPIRKLTSVREHSTGQDMHTMADVARWLGIDETSLTSAVHRAFIQLANEDGWITFPLCLAQVEIE